jgi:N-acetylmuramoyl-L-alanine amidase
MTVVMNGVEAMLSRGALGLTLVLLAVSACAAPPAVREPGLPVPGANAGAPVPRLPPIPRVDGDLRLRVSYPRESGYVATRDSTFIFGSTGSGDARLRINGQPVEVQPNGGFLAFLPVPQDSVYRLQATLDERTTTLEVPVSLPPAAPDPVGAATIVNGSVSPAGAWVALPGERIPVDFTGTAGGTAWIRFADGTRVPLVEAPLAGGSVTDFEVDPAAALTRQEPGTGLARYRGFFAARRMVTGDPSVAWPQLTGEPRRGLPREAAFETREREAGAPEKAGAGPLGRALEPSIGGVPAGGAMVVLAVDGDTARQPLRLNLLLADPDRPRVGTGWDPDPPEENGDDHVIARPGPGGGPYHYVWRNGVELELTGERNGIYRVRLTDDLDAWTPAADIRLRPAGEAPPTSRVTTVRLDPRVEYVDVHLALDRRLPYAVEEDEGSVSLLVFGATSRANFLQHGRTDPFIQRAEWSQPADGLFRLDVHLTEPPWGYETFWGAGDDLVLRLKRPPTIDPGNPLTGITVGVDAGHGGADRFTMGPTGLTEADANLGVALALRDALERRGARVVLSRPRDTTLSLVERTRLARDEDVDIWVSVHNNAFPDGVNPWENNGTSVYYNHPRSAPLAWSVHRELLADLGLRDLGVGRADLHQPRFTWAPAILTETAFMMIPRQEAFLRTDAGRERIAEAHARGIEAWLRVRADAGR